MRARIRLTLEKNKPWIRSPHYLTSPDETTTRAGNKTTRGQEYAAVGIDPILLNATKQAVRSAIAWLVGEKGLTREEAYMLCSVVADLKIVEAVDIPHYAVSCSIPLSIFHGFCLSRIEFIPGSLVDNAQNSNHEKVTAIDLLIQLL
ncbi:hypothetical protein E4U43_001815 [Claviceps pusilla]|uniref:Acetamidase n=1 Tax=Claviceps pusilla TaxID=123648 RepID=A0A9P7NI64_9HYPO|nr:hypothetical protein E4U43_001815 [Claviceps pusilla]